MPKSSSNCCCSRHCFSYLLSLLMLLPLLLQVKCTNYMRVLHMFRLPQPTVVPPLPSTASFTLCSTQNNAKLCTALVVAVVVVIQCVAVKDKNKQGNKSFFPQNKKKLGEWSSLCCCCCCCCCTSDNSSREWKRKNRLWKAIQHGDLCASSAL